MPHRRLGTQVPDLNTDADVAAGSAPIDAAKLGKGKFNVVYQMNGAERVDANGIMDSVVTVTPAANVADGDMPFPDIERLLRGGGTIELVLNIGPKGSKTHTVVGDTDEINRDAQAVADIFTSSLTPAKAATFKHRLIISEIMWGRNRTDAAANDGGPLSAAPQWIEVYNNGGALKPDLAASPADPVVAQGEGDQLYLVFHTSKTDNLGTVIDLDHDNDDADNSPDIKAVVVDSVSLVNSFGVFWAPKGNGGNTAFLGAAGQAVLPSPLNSMYRKITLAAGAYKAKADAPLGGLDGLGLGTEAGSWEKSVGAINTGEYFIGSPGSVHSHLGAVITKFDKSPAAVPPTTNFGTADAPKNLDPGSGVIINEVRNDTSGANLDWIELFNNTDPAPADVTSTNVENWTISIVTVAKDADGNYYTADADDDDGHFKDTNIATLPKHKLAPGEYMVIYNRDPAGTGLAGGVNIDAVANQTDVNKGTSHVYTVSANLDLPSDKKFLIILRNGNDKAGTHEKIVDFAGNGYFTRQEDDEFDTEIWPLIGWTAPAVGDLVALTDNTFASADQSWGRKTALGHAVGDADPKEAAKRASTQLNRGVYWPKGREGNRMHKDDWLSFGYMGTGYDRAADGRSSPGTPGYPNVAINIISDDRDGEAKHTAYAFGGTVTISEVMYDAGPRWNLVQWIELYNSSMSETIDLAGWRLEIRNKEEEVTSYVDSSFNFGSGAKILPNQTLLIVSGAGSTDVDSDHVYNLYQHHRRELGLLARDSVLLSPTGFYLSLHALVNQGGRTYLKMIDEAGNVEVSGANREVMWPLFPRDLAARQSLVRQYGSRTIDGTSDPADDGTMQTSWRQSDITGAGLSYYGHRNDIGTPGFRLGGPLPVSLSSFRPVRNQTTGHVDITWITQSELNNAGFNILRSEGKGHAFEVINVKGIVAGHGTTSEKHVYKFTDTTAKPNVVYYYQIEDVSLNGNRTTLRTTHLRGNVSAGGKLTTTWSSLKLQR